VHQVRVGDRVLVPFTTSCGACDACGRGLTARCQAGRLFGYGDPDHLDAPALQGAQAALVRVPSADTTLVVVPAGIEDPLALLLTDNLPTAWEAVQRAAPQDGQPLVVVGLGAVGLCAIAAARALGADPVLGIDPVPGRRAMAERLGADATAAPDDAVATLRGTTVGAVVEAAGAEAAQRLAFDLVSPGGILSIIAVQTADTFAFSPVEVYDTNLTIRAGRASVRATLDGLLPTLAAGALNTDVARVLTHVGVPLADGPAVYRRFADREDGLIKAAFAPDA
jgi:alcohol dehydrogenase